ncbi:sigma-70 family RNA polymerase sigma factor [Nannocystis sp. RBIL2]|uniref:RNA polymerase sigma factor n=1 Tax=Nannocystis sp. RBIL2 TaxID=2996788 RepID=UPI00226D6256|nr:sigma-70 family RNA polymerase sigma factor [Nannocystis sp. RBIL2]
MSTPRDSELLEAWRAGDRAAGNVLFGRHFAAIYRFFRNKTGDEAEDLVQRTFMACAAGRERFHADAPFRAYLFSAARNVLREHFRGRHRGREPVDIDALSVADLAPGPSTWLAARAEENVLLRALRKIPLASQIVLELYYWERFTGVELGRFLQVSEETARGRIRAAKRQLEQAIREVETDPVLVSTTLSHIDAWAEALREQVVPSP